MAISPLPLFDSLQGAAATQAAGIFNPILEMIARREADARQAAIQQQQSQMAATTKAYADAREPTAQLYNSAIGQSTAVQEAIRKALAGEGQEQGSDFARKLAEMGAPQADAQAMENSKKWKDSEGVGYTLGMNDVSRLISRAAGARDYLEKQPGIAQEESNAALMATLADLAKEYGGEREEIQAQLPGKIRDIQGDLYNDEWKRREYIDTITQKAADRKAANEELYLKQKLTMQQLGQTAKLKSLDRQFKAQQAALDRELKAAIAAANNETKIATDNPPKPNAKASGPNMKYNADGTPNPNYQPTPKPGNETLTGPRQSSVVNTVRSRLLKNGKLRQTIAHASGGGQAAINRQIAQVLKQQKIGWNSPQGLQIRALIRDQIDGVGIFGETGKQWTWSGK